MTVVNFIGKQASLRSLSPLTPTWPFPSRPLPRDFAPGPQPNPPVKRLVRGQSLEQADLNLFFSSADDIPPEVVCPRTIIKRIPVGVSGAFVRWEEPTYTDASTKTGETVRVEHKYKVLWKSHQQPIHLSELFFPVGLYMIRYSFTDWNDNKATCSFYVLIGKIRFYDVHNKGFLKVNLYEQNSER